MHPPDIVAHRLQSWNILSNAKIAGCSISRYKRTLQPWRNILASQNLWNNLNKVVELGEDKPIESHSGCVNALHWSQDGSVLVSAGDDTRIHLWRLDPSQSDGTDEYPLHCTAKIHTGHTANIFSAQILGNSSRIVTCAADKQVRVFDVNRAGLYNYAGELTEYQEEQSCIRVFKCHRDRVKRIVTEDSPDYFLTVAEDGTVRQHDLRTPHRCSRRNDVCPPPLLSLPMPLSTISMSRLTPYYFVVAGESPYAYLFDRRHSGRRIKEEWGIDNSDDLTTCVRRFGRKEISENETPGHEHVTGSRMSQYNGHELLLSYSVDGVYLYSIRDPPEPPQQPMSAVLPPNKPESPSPKPNDDDGMDASGSHSDKEEDEEDEEELPENLKLPVIHPRRKYVGACNIETVKDVNFLGPRDEFVVSGSDDGNFFIWNKSTSQVMDILEGDESVVNVVEQHPFLPVLAVSGIDDTVKIFAPSTGPRRSSRISDKDQIIKNNVEHVRPRLRAQRIQLSQLLLQYRQAALVGDGELEDVECVQQ
ncbi:hypothetical protein M422DRAFT_22796 [Sphaerobolus stellatus SS14]|nr:hypothetical protein M422DRAFT_22796 [Sphaerobolus stellatus SS14]